MRSTAGQTGLAQGLDATKQAAFPDVGIGANAAQAFAPYRTTIKGSAHFHHRGHTDHRPQPGDHVDGHLEPGRRGIGLGPDPVDPRGPGGQAHLGHGGRLSALGRRNGGLSGSRARAPRRRAGQGRSRHRGRERGARPARRGLPRQRLRRLRPGQLRVLRQHRARDQTAAHSSSPSSAVTSLARRGAPPPSCPGCPSP